MELKEVLTALNRIKIRGIEMSMNDLNPDLGKTVTTEDVLMENAIVGSMFMEDIEAMYIASFLIDYSHFVVPENEIVFKMLIAIFLMVWGVYL